MVVRKYLLETGFPHNYRNSLLGFVKEMQEMFSVLEIAGVDASFRSSHSKTDIH